MTLRELIKQTVGELTFCVEEGKAVNWAALDFKLTHHRRHDTKGIFDTVIDAKADDVVPEIELYSSEEDEK